MPSRSMLTVIGNRHWEMTNQWILAPEPATEVGRPSDGERFQASRCTQLNGSSRPRVNFLASASAYCYPTVLCGLPFMYINPLLACLQYKIRSPVVLELVHLLTTRNADLHYAPEPIQSTFPRRESRTKSCYHWLTAFLYLFSPCSACLPPRDDICTLVVPHPLGG